MYLCAVTSYVAGTSVEYGLVLAADRPDLASPYKLEAGRLNPSLVSVVLHVGSQGPFRENLRKQLRQDSWTSVGVRGDCHSISHSAVEMR